MPPSPAVQRRADGLTASQRVLLEDAHHDLRKAVSAYARLVPTGSPAPDEGEPGAVEALRRRQTAVQEAEQRLWELRRSLLGWPRPTDAPSALLVADWFDEDDLYDR